MASTRNKNAGKHPSYDKLGMSEARRKKKIAYDKKYSASKKQKDNRAETNRKNKEAGTYGNGDGKDVSHGKKGKLTSESQSTNRARNGQNGKSTKRDLNKPLAKSKFDPADYNKNGYVTKKERKKYNKSK
jgi:hypothetical protein